MDYNLVDVWERFLTFQGSCDLGRRATQRAEQPKHLVGWCMSALAGNTCLNVAGVVSTMKTPSRTSFKRVLPSCSIGFHREAFNSTIHHLLSLRNGVKHTLIEPCGAARYITPTGLVFMHVCCSSSSSPFIPLNPGQQVDGASMALESGDGLNRNAFACRSLCAVLLLSC